MIRAIIFDLDGTLTDTEPLHLDAFNQVLRERGLEIPPEEYFARMVGLDDRDCFTMVLREHGRSADAAALSAMIARKTLAYTAMIRSRDVVRPGAERFVRACAQRFPLMVATGTLRAEAELILGRAGLRELFLDVLGAEDAGRGKPAPDIFIAALGRLGYLLRQHDPVKPRQCLVVEDTPAGIAAARAAGMRVLAIAATVAAPALGDADFVSSGLETVDLDRILRACAD
jgi:HAD superfamily hydrolase (TIGR01509 family)